MITTLKKDVGAQCCKLELQLEEILKSKKIKANCPLDQKFRREHKDNPEYKALKTQSARERFKIAWCHDKYNKLRIDKSKIEETEDAETANGVYMPFDCLVREEGGAQNETNVRAAHNHALECLKKRGKWVKRNPMTKRIEFLHVKYGSNKRFSQKWQLKQTESKEQEHPDVQTTAAAIEPVEEASKSQAAAAANADEQNSIDKGHPAHEKGETPPDKSQTPDKGARQRKPVEIAISKANKLKTNLNAARAQAVQMLASIETAKERRISKFMVGFSTCSNFESIVLGGLQHKTTNGKMQHRSRSTPL